MVRLLYLFCFFIFGFCAAAASPLPDRIDYDHGSVRLILGDRHDDGSYDGGVEVRLGSGWKTYWRFPGVSGLPPRFDWSGSENVDLVEVFYPVPERIFDLEIGELIGYRDRVIFPVRIFPSDISLDSGLSLRFDYGVCSDICIPVSAHLGTGVSSLGFSGSDFSSDLSFFQSRIPVLTRGVDDLRFETVTVRASGEDYFLRIGISSMTSSAPVSLFFRGSELIYFSSPRLVSSDEGRYVYESRIDGLEDLQKTSAFPDEDIWITASQGASHIESDWNLSELLRKD